MPDTIIDGRGRGNVAHVNDNGALNVSSVSRSKEHHANITHGNAYNILVNVTPTGAGDCFLYMKNTGTNNIIVEGFSAYVASAERLDGYLAQVGTPVGGAATPTPNLNSGSAKTPTGTFLTGNDITGMSGGYLFQRARVPANTATNNVNFDADIVITPQTTFTAYALTGGILIEGHMTFWIEEEDV
jgi:hypothetical protein